MHVSRLSRAILAAGVALCAVAPARAVDLLSGFGGPRDYGTEFLFRNDDQSTNEIALPFSIDFFGQQYTSFYVNNNGNVTFGSALGNYTPEAFPLSSGGEEGLSGTPIIAPYWADVDTGADPGDDSNLAWVFSPNANTVVVTWDNVGYFSQHNDKRNDFQLVLRNRAETGAGNFDIDFRYRKLEWTTGDASGGDGGLGGTPAQAGFDAGNGINFLMLPGSRTSDVLDLVNTSNVAADTPGLWTFAVRNGALPDGATASNPLMPVVTEAGWVFEFGVEPGQRVFVDPDVAIGYDFIVDGGPNIASILLPTVGDGSYELWLWNGTDWVRSDDVLTAGDVYSFATGQQRIRILGIEIEANVDPTNPTAFVTGLTFDAAGQVSLRQVAVTVAVPEPGTWAMLGLGLVVLAAGTARSRRKD